MAKKKTEGTEGGGGDILQTAAKAIGSALGTLAAKTGMAHPEKKSKKIGKLPKKNKKRLPRKVKKEAKKAAAKTASKA